MRVAPSQDRARETLKALLDATEQVAERVGFQEATTKEIARVAGVSVGTLYRYFPSKEALLAALVRRQWEAGVQEYGGEIARVQPGTFEEIVDRVVKLAFDMVASRVKIFGRMRIELGHVAQLNAELMAHATTIVKGALEQRTTELKEVDLEVASAVVVRTVVFLARIGVQEYPELVESGRWADEVGRMVRRYLALEDPR